MEQRPRAWVWPYWLEQQADTDPDPVGRGPSANHTARNWTSLANLASIRTATVDERGLVTPWPGGWSLDWWVGADDRWHFPSRESGVRQRLVEGTPVVETALRVPGGDAVHRAYAVQPSSTFDLGELLMVEIHNQTSVPFAVALAVRPYHPDGVGTIHQIDLVDNTVMVDGRTALVLPDAPRLTAGGTSATGDSADVVVGGRAGETALGRLTCPDGMAQAAFLFPLAHTAVLRVAIPLDPSLARAGPNAATLQRAPTGSDAARAWQAQSKRGLRVELPAGRLADAVEANRRYLLLFQQGGAAAPGPKTASLVAALDRWGFHREAAELVAHPVDRDHVEATAPALWAVAEHWRLTGDDDLVRRLVPAIARGVRWIERRRHPRRRRVERAVRGLMPPAGPGPGTNPDPTDYAYSDSFWALGALLGSATLLAAAQEDDAAETVARWAAELRADINASLTKVVERSGTRAIPASPAGPAGPVGAIGRAAVESLVACCPLQLMDALDTAVAATAEAVRRQCCTGDAVSRCGSSELSPLRTLLLAAVELEAGDRRALDRLRWLVDAATPTWTWPEVIDAASGRGCDGAGHDGATATEFCSLVRNLLVREVTGGLAVLSLLPDGWLGQGIEVHGAPTYAGELSYAVRWHGDRPALLWELRRGEGAAPVRLTVPGLDAGWSSTDAVGEALLAPIAGGPVGPATVAGGRP
jgi:hypothetical protein